MRPAIEIRRMTAADIAPVMELAAGLRQAPHYSQETWQQMLEKDAATPRLALVAVDAASRALLGFVVASIVHRRAEIESIAVAAHTQRRGIGRRLLQAAIEELGKQDIEEILLEVRVSNQAAIGLYREFGFAETGRRTRYYLDPVEDALLMRLECGRDGCRLWQSPG